MFLENVDWSDPRFAQWNLSNLGQLNRAQLDASFDDDEIDFPNFTDAELIELAQKVPCRVDLSLSNLYKDLEQSQIKQSYNQANFDDLMPYQKRIITRKMEECFKSLKKMFEKRAKQGGIAVSRYKKYVDADHLKRQTRRRADRALAPYYEERYLRNRFNRIKALGDITTMNSESSHAPNQDLNDEDFMVDSDDRSMEIYKRFNDQMTESREDLDAIENEEESNKLISTPRVSFSELVQTGTFDDINSE